MKRFKIIACFLLMFSLSFSEESSVVAEQKARIAQLEQQIETQNKIIARYERLEDKINSRMSQSLSLDKEVKETYKENLNEIDGRFQSKINWILALVSFAFGVVALISIMPLYQSWTSRKMLKEIEEHGKKLDYQEAKVNHALVEIYSNNVLMFSKELQICLEEDFLRHTKNLTESFMEEVSYLFKNSNKKGTKSSLIWLSQPLQIANNRNLKNEEEVLKTIKKEVKKYSKEYDFILNLLEEAFSEYPWKKEFKVHLKKIFCD